jgi:DNA-directed RNA polymerase subunit F
MRTCAQESIELTRAEALQLSAVKPSSSVEVHAIVESCDERLSPEEVEQLLQICAEML